MFLMFSLTSKLKKISKLVRTSRTSKHWVANSFNICLNFKASNWAQFSSDLQNSNSFEKLRISSINSTKKNFFFARAHAAYARCIYIYLLAMHLNVFVCTLFAGFKSVKAQIRPNRIGTDSAKNQISFDLVPRWQKPDRIESFRDVMRRYVSKTSNVNINSLSSAKSFNALNVICNVEFESMFEIFAMMIAYTLRSESWYRSIISIEWCVLIDIVFTLMFMLNAYCLNFRTMNCLLASEIIKSNDSK
jgi:hypothetical protein